MIVLAGTVAQQEKYSQKIHNVAKHINDNDYYISKLSRAEAINRQGSFISTAHFQQ